MEIARVWRQQPSNLRLLGSRCLSCEALLFPSRSRCPECGSMQIEPYQYQGTGTLLSVTNVYEAPRSFSGQVPYLAGIVRLAEGPVVPALITDADPGSIRPGAPVVMVTRRISCESADSPIVYGYKFAPDESDG